LVKLLSYNRFSFVDLSILLLVFSLPFFYKYGTVGISLVSFFSLVEIFRIKKFPTIQLYWFLPVLGLYYIASELISGGSAGPLQKRYILILFPLALALSANFQGEQLRPRIYKSFVIANLLAIMVCLVRAIVRSIRIQEGEWIFNPKVIQDTEHDFLTSSVMGGNYFFAEDFSLFMHPTYWGIQLVLAQYFVFKIFKTATKKEKGWLVISYAILLLAIFMLSSKAVIMTTMIVAFWILLRMEITVVIKASTMAGCIVVFTLFVLFNPRLRVFKETFSIEQLTHPDPNARFGHDLRILSWDASIDIIKNNWFVGVGEAKKTAALANVYERKGYVVPAEQQLNCHNEYFEILLGGGIIAFGIFIAGMVTLLVIAINKRDDVLLTFVAIIAFNCLFESLLERHYGILFISVFVSILTTRKL